MRRVPTWVRSWWPLVANKNPRYTHIATGEIFELINTKPLTLVPAFRSRSEIVRARKPTKVTFGRDYQRVREI